MFTSKFLNENICLSNKTVEMCEVIELFAKISYEHKRSLFKTSSNLGADTEVFLKSEVISFHENKSFNNEELNSYIVSILNRIGLSDKASVASKKTFSSFIFKKY